MEKRLRSILRSATRTSIWRDDDDLLQPDQDAGGDGRDAGCGDTGPPAGLCHGWARKIWSNKLKLKCLNRNNCSLQETLVPLHDRAEDGSLPVPAGHHRRSPGSLHFHELRPAASGWLHHHPLLLPRPRHGSLRLHPEGEVRGVQSGGRPHPRLRGHPHRQAALHLRPAGGADNLRRPR